MLLAFKASLDLLSDLGKSFDRDTEWLFLGTAWLLGSGSSRALSFYFLGGKQFYMMSDILQVFGKSAVSEERKVNFLGGLVPLFCVQVSCKVYGLLFSSEIRL